eukprot:1496865-Rhodomonas_salina.1
MQQHGPGDIHVVVVVVVVFEHKRGKGVDLAGWVQKQVAKMLGWGGLPIGARVPRWGRKQQWVVPFPLADEDGVYEPVGHCSIEL